MLTIFLRTILVYCLLLCAIRLMGKRQLGELELSEFITTLLLSELAAMPITNQEIPVMFAIIPIFVITTFEVTVSFLMTKFPKMKQFISPRPSTLIRRGKIDRKELGKIRISADELISELRQNNITDLSEVDYAILERNGKITVIPKAKYRPPTLSDLNIKARDGGIMHLVVTDGKIDKQSLAALGKDEKWVMRQLERFGYRLNEVFIMTADDGGKVTVIRKE